jgi:hypothetical protein
MNMSYCRFQNTLKDFEDCMEHFNSTELSKSESEVRLGLLRQAYDLLEQCGATINEEVEELMVKTFPEANEDQE